MVHLIEIVSCFIAPAWDIGIVWRWDRSSCNRWMDSPNLTLLLKIWYSWSFTLLPNCYLCLSLFYQRRTIRKLWHIRCILHLKSSICFRVIGRSKNNLLRSRSIILEWLQHFILLSLFLSGILNVNISIVRLIWVIVALWMGNQQRSWGIKFINFLIFIN